MSDFYAELREQLILHEGMRLKPYRCPAGKWTIGVGRNAEDNGISTAEALYMLHNDLLRVTDELERNLPCMTSLSGPRRMAMIDLCFATGLPVFLQFRKMRRALCAGNYNRAADELLDSRWARIVGKRAVTLAGMVRNG